MKTDITTDDLNNIYWAILELKKLNVTMNHIDRNFYERYQLNEITIKRAEEAYTKISRLRS